MNKGFSESGCVKSPVRISLLLKCNMLCHFIHIPPAVTVHQFAEPQNIHIIHLLTTYYCHPPPSEDNFIQITFLIMYNIKLQTLVIEEPFTNYLLLTFKPAILRAN